MKQRILFIVIVSGLSSCLNQMDMGQKEELKKVIAWHLQSYPESTLMDLYKSFFQDEYGPGHLLQDTSAAWDYFNRELDAMESRGKYYAEPCGLGIRFIRVPMDLVKDSILDKRRYFTAFLESSRNFSSPDMDVWRKKWEGILSVVEEMKPGLPHYETDKNEIAEMLNRGAAMVHHSQSYRDAYDPHYRIMTLDQWEQLNETLQIEVPQTPGP